MFQKRKIASEPSGAPGIEWRLEACGGALVVAAADALEVPLAGSWRRRCSGKVGGNGLSAGFEGQLFSPGATRRGCATGPNGGWLSGGCESASNVPPRLEVVPNGAAPLLLGIDARRGRQPIVCDFDQKAVLLISFAVQSSSPLAAVCCPAASLAWIPPLYSHLKEMHACGSGSRALWHLVPIGRPPLAQWLRTCEEPVCTLSVDSVREY